MNHHGRIVTLNLYAETPQAFQSTLAVYTGGEIVNYGGAFGYGSYYREPVADGFVARDGRQSADSRGWLDFQTIGFNHYPQISTVIDFA